MFSVRSFRMSAAVLAASVLAAGCGGGGNPGYFIPAPSATPSLAPTALAFQLVIPTVVTAAKRRPAYVSPATASVAVELDSGSVIAQNVGSGATGCTAGTNAITCTIPVPGATSGTHALIVKTYDAANTGTSSSFAGLKGNLLSSATLSVTVAANATTTVSAASLNGVPSGILIAPQPGQSNVSGSQTSGFTFTGSSATFIVVGLDADGNPIIGQGAPLIAATNVPTGMTVTPVTGSQDLFTIATSATYTGGSPTFTAQQSGSTSGAVSSTTTITPKSTLLAIAQESPTPQISIYNVASPASPSHVATLALPACPSGNTQSAANAVFDAAGDIITGYTCAPTSGAETGALLAYVRTGGSYAATATVLDATYPVELVATSGSVLDTVSIDTASSNIPALGIYTLPSTISGSLTASSISDDAPFSDMILHSGAIYFTVGSFYEFPTNGLNFAGLVCFCPGGVGTNTTTSGFGVAFDASGNFWGTSSTYQGPGPNAILEMSATNGDITETFTPSTVVEPAGLDFDGNGNLWVVDASSGKVYGFAPPTGSSLGSPIGTISAAGALFVRAPH